MFNAQAASGGETSNAFLIVSVPHPCEGTVTSLEFCYETMGSSLSITIYRLDLSLEPIATIGSSFTVTSTTTNDGCVDVGNTGRKRKICCDTCRLAENDQFQLPKVFTFGIQTANNNGLLAVPNDSLANFTLYRVQGSGIMPESVDSFSLPSDSEVNDQFPLLRFNVGAYN